MMSDDQILDEFRAAGALLEGHFILSSGLRSPKYLQCARVLMDGACAERLAGALASKLPADIRGRIDAVVSPAMGGVIIGHEMGRAHGVGMVAAARVPDGRHVIDVDAEAELSRQAAARLPGFTAGIAASSAGTASAS